MFLEGAHLWLSVVPWPRRGAFHGGEGLWPACFLLAQPPPPTPPLENERVGLDDVYGLFEFRLIVQMEGMDKIFLLQKAKHIS